MFYVGDYLEDATVYIMFNTFTSNDPAASSTITNFINTDVHIHKDDGLTQRNNAAGITVSVNFDGITGSHMIKIDTSDDTVAAFWVTGADYFVRVEGATVDGGTLNVVVGHFSIENRFKEVDVTSLGGSAQSLTDLKDFADAGYDPGTNKVQGVVLVDTTTTNTDMVTEPPTVAEIVDEWETQSQADPTGFHVNIKEISDTAQTANDNGADINTLLSVLSTGIADDTNNETLIEQLKLIRSLIESQRGSHTHQTMGNIFYVSPNDGAADTHANGNRGGVADPYLTIQDCIDNAVTDSNHDIVMVNADAAGGATTYTETITCDKRYMFLRGPGRDCVLTRAGDGDTVTITADGVEISGFQINTAGGAASGNSIAVASADFTKIHHCWFSDVADDAIDIDVGSNYVIRHNNITGCNQGVDINSGSGSAQGGIIEHNSIFTTTGHAIRMAGADASFGEIHHNRIWNIGDDGVFINSNCTDTIVAHNEIGNCANETIDNDGTDTVLINNITLESIPGLAWDEVISEAAHTTANTGGLLLRKIAYILGHVKINVTDADGSIAVRNLADSGDEFTGSVTDDSTTTVRTALT